MNQSCSSFHSSSIRSVRAILRQGILAIAIPAFVGFVAQVGTNSAYAQVTSSTIHGTVTDSSGAVVPNANVTVVNTSTGVTTRGKTNASGYYVISLLQPGGPYSVTVDANGFQSFTAKGITLSVAANWETNARLQVGAASQTVAVSATALQVETQNTQLEQVATATQIEGVPLEGRDASGLQKFQPGVVESSDRFGSYSSNGSQTPQNSYVADGVDINDGPLQNEGLSINPDALQEQNTETSTMNPEYARNSGAVVNQVIKSGTNEFHGSGFEFYRDTFLNNGNYFSQVRPVFHQNLYGGTLGGPVLKNRLFFFAAYQGLRNRTAATTLSSTLSTAQFAGDFTSDPNYSTGGVNSAGLTNNPLPFAVGSCAAGETWNHCLAQNNGNINIPTSSWNPLAAKLIQSYVPTANTPGNLYTFNSLNTAAQDQGIVRIDYTISPNDSLWASTIFMSAPATSTLSFGGGSFPGFGAIQADHYKIFSAAYTHTFNANLINQVSAGYFRNNFPAVIPAQITQPTSLGFAINPQLSQAGVPYMAIGSYFALGNSYEGPQPRTDTNLDYRDDLTWTRGNHTLKFGGLYEQFRVHNPFGYLNNGYYAYNGGGQYSSGDPLIDFVLGIPDQYEQANDGFVDVIAMEAYAYAQDSWRVTPDFTFNYGLAWDVEGPNQNKQFNGLGIVCWSNSNTQSKIFAGGPPGLTYNGDPGCNEAGSIPTRWNHFAPRLGFAWSPSNGPSKLIGDHALSIRGAFGVYFNRDQEEQSLQNLTDPPVFYVSHGAADFGGSPAFVNPYTDVAGNGSETNPFPYATPTAGSTVNWSIYNELGLSTFSPNFNVPYTYNYNLNIQRLFGSSTLVQIGYVGSVSHRLASWHEGDYITAAGHASCLANPACAADPNYIHLFFPQYTVDPAIVPGTGGGAIPSLPNGIPWYTSVARQESEGSANYNSFQASLQQAMKHGFQFTAAYTYSHALDNGSGYESSTGGAGRVYNYTPGFQYLNYGSSDFDARQRLALTYVYVVPTVHFMNNNPIVRETLSGWGISGVSAFQAGFPVGINMGTDRSYWCDALSFFGCGDVPQTSSFHIGTHNPRATATHQYFDTASFSPEPLGTFGNTSRNFFHGPGFDYTNLSVTKDIHFGSNTTRYVQLRLEGFNVFNHANFAGPSGDFSSPTFGQVTGVKQSADPNGDPSPGRAVQLAGKFYF